MNNNLWQQEEFEDLIDRGLIALYEATHKDWKKVGGRVRIKPDELAKLKKIGLYFSPGDRYSLTDCIDVKNDTLPNISVVSFDSVQEDKDPNLITKDRINANEDIGGYLKSLWCLKWKNNILPKRWQPLGPGLLYAVYALAAREEGGLIGHRRFVKINPQTGEINNCYQPYQTWNGVKYIETFTEEGDDNVFMYDRMIAALAMGFWTDKKYLWNVTTTEDKVKRVLFGVYEEQIQSLFYARDLPRTKTGRKRPILHWVSAHKRRIKEGTPVDIEKHLRGITAFEMNGTTFEITQPVKKLNLDINKAA